MNDTCIAPEDFRARYAANVTGAAQDVARDNLAHLGRIMKLLPVGATALEIGSYTGGTTVWLLEHGIQRIDVVDPFTGSPEHQGIVDCSTIAEEFERNTAAHSHRIRVLQSKSEDGLPRLAVLGRRYDFIYVDGSHDSREVIVDATLGFRLLNPGGVMVFDDYGWNFYDEPYRNPKPAIDFFLASHADQLRVLEQHYQVSIQKL